MYQSPTEFVEYAVHCHGVIMEDVAVVFVEVCSARRCFVALVSFDVLVVVIAVTVTMDINCKK